MRLPSLFRRAGAAVSEAEGLIRDLRVVRGPRGPHWLFRLDGRAEAVFEYEPSPLSPERRDGQRVRIRYRATPDSAGIYRADSIAAA
jgi:hypothetical protein